MFETGRPGRAIQADEVLGHADVVVLLGDRPSPPALMEEAARLGTLLLPLWASGSFALQCRYGTPDRPGEAFTRHDAEIRFLRDTFFGLVCGLGRPTKRDEIRAASRCILGLLAAEPSNSGHWRIPHPRAAIYLVGLRAAAGLVDQTGHIHSRGMLERLAIQTPDWLVANLLALDGISAEWPAGIVAQAEIVSALLRGDGAGRLWAMLEMLRASQASHVTPPLMNLLAEARFSPRGAKRMSPRAIKTLLQPKGEGPDPPLSLEECAVRFLQADNVPGFAAMLRPLEAAAVRRRSEVPWEQVARWLGSHVPLERLQAYVLLCVEPDQRFWNEASWLCTMEGEWAGKTGETRVLWLLLLAIKAVHTSAPPEPAILRGLRRAAHGVQDQLPVDSTLDNGGECRTELETLIALVDLAIAKAGC